MTSKFLIAAASVSFLFGASAMAADAPKAPKLSTAVYKNIQAAQAASGKQDFKAALTAVEAAKQATDRTPYDNYVINRFAMQAHAGLNDLDTATVDAEAAADTDPAVIPEAEKPAVYKVGLQLSSRAKHNDKVVKYAKLLLALTPPPSAQDMGMITTALFNAGDAATAASLAQKNIDAATAAGQKPALADLQIIMNAQAKANDQINAQKTLEIMIADYNQPQDWSLILSIAMTTKGMRDIDYVYLGRLMLQQGREIAASDAQLVGNTANKLALYGDAEAMQKAGGPAPDAREAGDKKSVPAQIAASAKQNGEYSVKLAEVLYGYGMLPEALTAAQLAKTKGGMSDPSEADMVTGMIQAATGKYAEAGTTFAGIQQSNQASARVVRLWGYFVKLKASPATAAAK
jgi:hypothetical protein